MSLKSLKYIVMMVIPVLMACHSGHMHDDHEGHDHDHDHDHDYHHQSETSEKHEEDNHESEGAITLSSEFHVEHNGLQDALEYEIISPGVFNDVIMTSGEIQGSNADFTTISAKKSGIIHFSGNLSQGEEVKAGQTIATISSDGIQGGDLNRASAANLEAARREYERLKPLYEDGLVTATVFREAERAYREAEALAGTKTSSGSAAVQSPIAGSLQSLLVKSGEYVEVGAPIAVVTKNSSQILKADLPARLSSHLPEIVSANFIAAGATQPVNISELDGKRISGNNLSGIDNGYIPVYFSFSGNTLSFPAGFAQVFLICGERQGVISLPKEALVEIQGNNYAYVAIDDDSFEKRLVKTGASDGKRVEIKEGLNPGEKVVSKGASIVRMAEVSAVAPPAHSHSH